MNQALKQGKWLWKAPYGYKNMQSVSGTEIIKYIDIDPITSDLVRLAFHQMETGIYTAEEVRHQIAEKGMTLTKQSFLNMLQNIFYEGKILIKPYKGEPEMIIKGQHQAIVSEETFQAVQYILSGKKKSYKGLTKDTETPLVGKLYCSVCNRPMTGSGSKGNGGIYHYYHCQRKYGCKNAIPAKTANEVFENYLSGFQARPQTVVLFEAILKDTFKTSGIDRELEKSRIKSEIKQLDERLEKAAIKNLDGVWDDNTFLKHKETFESQKNELSVKLKGLNTIEPKFLNYLTNSTQLIGDLMLFYKSCDTTTRKKLVGSIFPDKLYFDKKVYRTTKTNEFVDVLFKLDASFKENNPAKNAGLVDFAPPAGLEPATL